MQAGGPREARAGAASRPRPLGRADRVEDVGAYTSEAADERSRRVEARAKATASSCWTSASMRGADGRRSQTPQSVSAGEGCARPSRSAICAPSKATPSVTLGKSARSRWRTSTSRSRASKATVRACTPASGATMTTERAGRRVQPVQSASFLDVVLPGLVGGEAGGGQRRRSHQGRPAGLLRPRRRSSAWRAEGSRETCRSAPRSGRPHNRHR